MLFIVTLMAGQQHFRTMPEELFPVLYYAKYSVRLI